MLTKETIKGMKKEELIALVRADKNRLVIADKNRLEELVELVIADQNRLEYLLDKKVAQERDIERYKRGLEELQQAADIMLKQVAYLYGGKGKKIKLRPIPDLSDWGAEIERNEATKEMTIKLVQKME